jgi:hypothetical protein
MTMAKVGAMGSVNKTDELKTALGKWKAGQGRIKGHHIQGEGGHGRIGSGMLVNQATVDGVAEVLYRILETKVMKMSRHGGRVVTAYPMLG